jgi:DNA-binding XRE family transcriptional regulator
MMPEKRGGFVGYLRIASKRYRADNSLSQEELAKLIGCGRTTLGNFEKGRHMLGEPHLEALIALVRGRNHHLASRLRNLADIIDSPECTEEVAREEFRNEFTRIAGTLGLFPHEKIK